MQDRPITDIIRQVRILVPEDSAAKAAGLMRANALPELPVVNYGRVVGLVHEKDLVAALSDTSGGQTAPVSKIMRSEPVLANKYMTLEQVADIFSRGDVAVLPVVDEYGAYQGVVARADVVALLGKVLRPQMVAGMATPLGVYLTTGAVSAGAGNIGLFLTGVTLGLFIILSSTLVYSLSVLIERLTGMPVLAMLHSPMLPVVSSLDAALYIYAALQFILVLAMMRLSPLSGYHAAEHMVVHAIEQGEPLDPEVVKQMPRVHPRCGTNLLVGVALFVIVTTRFSNSMAVLIAIAILILGWRTLGGYLQYFVTTKQPSHKQLANGVKVGSDIVERYQEKPNLYPDGIQRIWNVGLLQVMCGLFAIFAIAVVLTEALNLPNIIMP